MKVTEHYKENSERANKWLKEHAPDYVRECVEEMGHHLIIASKQCVALSEAAEVLLKQQRKPVPPIIRR